MEIIIFFALVALVLLYCMLRGAYEEKKTKELYRRHLQQDYGKYESRSYTDEQLLTISRLFQKNKETAAFYLDDITWNDLNMDGIFARINHTQSSSGAEYLYDKLRRPQLSPENMDRLEQDISYMQKQAEERVRLQMLFHELGSTGRFSLYDYLRLLDELGERGNKKHILGCVALAASILLIGVSASLGLIALIVVACINIATYLREKNKALPYLTSFAYIMRMLECAEAILREPLTGMAQYRLALEGRAGAVAPMHRISHLVFRMNVSSGNPLEVLADYVKMLTHVDIIQFNRMVKLVQANREQIEGLAEAVGYLDAIIAIGAFRKSLPYWCSPQLTAQESALEVTKGYHPSLQEPVANSFTAGRGMLLTGSNASGKSTFLKMTAINAILAQTLHTCAAQAYRGSCYRIYSSMALRDDLESGESYYIVEIKSLKRIMDAAGESEKVPLLCFVDEVLRGTNTVERIAASAQILSRLSADGVYCFAATHDIELTYLLESAYDNYHFEEEVKDKDVLFSYQLLAGRAQSRNAIRLLEVIGFSEEITAKAQEMAQQFMETGQWEESYVR